MNKRNSVFIVLLILTLGSICGLLVYRDNVRSDLSISTPCIMFDYKPTGSYVMEGESSPIIMGQISFYLYPGDRDRTYCEISVNFSSNYISDNVLRFNYWTMPGSQIPEGSVLISSHDNEADYSYKDQLTGMDVTFHFINGLVEGISFSGETISEYRNDFKHISFEIQSKFDNEIVLVNTLKSGTLMDPCSLNISGTENDKNMSGTLRMIPLSCVERGFNDCTTMSVILDIEGTSLPNIITDYVVSAVNGYGFSAFGGYMSYIDSDGSYIKMNVTYELSDEDGLELTLKGSITTFVRDSEYEIVDKTILNFTYGSV